MQYRPHVALAEASGAPLGIGQQGGADARPLPFEGTLPELVEHGQKSPPQPVGAPDQLLAGLHIPRVETPGLLEEHRLGRAVPHHLVEAGIPLRLPWRERPRTFLHEGLQGQPFDVRQFLMKRGNALPRPRGEEAQLPVPIGEAQLANLREQGTGQPLARFQNPVKLQGVGPRVHDRLEGTNRLQKRRQAEDHGLFGIRSKLDLDGHRPTPSVSPSRPATMPWRARPTPSDCEFFECVEPPGEHPIGL